MEGNYTLTKEKKERNKNRFSLYDSYYYTYYYEDYKSQEDLYLSHGKESTSRDNNTATDIALI